MYILNTVSYKNCLASSPGHSHVFNMWTRLMNFYLNISKFKSIHVIQIADMEHSPPALRVWGCAPYLLPTSLSSTMQTPFRMVQAVVPPITAVPSTTHPGSVSNYHNQPLITLR